MKYEVEFLTPAFLGNAEQSGQWRTPPFKALLRQWWRMVYAVNRKFDVDLNEMRRTEGMLFGNAWLDHEENGRTIADHCKSQVRIRLDRWSEGKLRSWSGLEQGTVKHPEVQRTGYRIGPQAYLGFGPLDGRSGTKLAKPNAAIQAGETATLSIAVPASAVDDIRAALALMNAYGTVGGRSRNGWGSLAIEPSDGSSNPDTSVGTRQQGVHEPDRRFIRPWCAALELDWPHAIGADDTGRPLVWRTAKSHDDWRKLMRHLAILKIGLRTMFVFPNNRPPHPGPLYRHWLAYPITRHGTERWSRNARLPNSLRFKVRPDRQDPKRLRGVIFHVPCSPPADFSPNPAAIEKVWQTTHRLLDELTCPRDRRRYAMIENDKRRNELKPSLDTLTLERSLE